MKSKWVKLVSMSIGAFMLLQVFAGCSSKSVEKPAGDTAKSSSQAATGTGTTSEFGPLYPIKGNVTLKVWMAWSNIASKYIKSYAENEAFIRAMQDTGVKLDFTHPASGQETESFNLMIASGEVADIMVLNKYKGGAVQGVKDGVFADITDLVPTYAPDYNNILKRDKEFWREATTTDGKIYDIPIYKEVPGKLEGEWSRMQFREDWLKEFGMKIPETFDEYEEYFKKVLEKKPGVVPFVLPVSGQEYKLEQPFELMPGFFLKNGKITSDRVESGLKDYLQLMNKWFKAGYISKDFVSSDGFKLFQAGKAACFIGTSIDVYQACKQLNIPVVTGPYPRLKAGQKLHAAYTLWPRNGDGCVFSAKSKYLKEALAFVNYGFHPEGYKTFQYGPKGVAWVPGPDGKPQYTDYMLNNPKYSISEVDFLIRLHSGWGGRMRDADRYSIPSNIKDPSTLDYRLKWADEDADASFRMPPFSLEPEQNTKRASIMSNVDTYANEMILKFIIGTEPLSNFDKYLQTVKSMNIDEAIAITQKAYDAHMNKK